MKSFIIAWKDFKIRATDKRGFLMMILMPLLLTAILGSALKNVMSEDASLPEMKVGVYNLDDSELSKSFIDDVLGNEEFKDFLSVKMVSSHQKLKQMIQDEKLDAGIILPENWGGNLNQGELKQATILGDPGKTLQSSVLESIAGTFSERVSSVALSTKAVMTDLAQAQPVLTGKMDMGKVGGEIAGELRQTSEMDTGKFIGDEPLGKKAVTSMQYYAAGMAAMFLLFNLMVGAKSLMHERHTETLARLMSTPTGQGSILIGKFLGTFYFAVLQLLVFMGVTHWAFGVHWGSNVVQSLTIGIVYAFAVSGLSMLFASVLKDEKTAELAGGTLVQILAVLGGSMLPITVFPEVLKKISNIAPNKWALSSFLEAMAGTTWAALSVSIIVLLMIGIVSLAVGSWRLKVR